MGERPIFRREQTWRRWLGAYPHDIVNLLDRSIELVGQALGGEDVRCWGTVKLQDGTDIDSESRNDFIHVLMGRRPALDAGEVVYVSMHVGEPADGVGTVTTFSRGPGNAVWLVVYGSDKLAVPGVYDEMRAVLDKGRRRWDPPHLRALHLLLGSLWIVLAAGVVAVAVSKLVALILLGVAITLVLLAAAVRWVLPRVLPPLEWLASEDAQTQSSGWVKQARGAGLFVLGVVVTLVIGKLLG